MLFRCIYYIMHLNNIGEHKTNQRIHWIHWLNRESNGFSKWKSGTCIIRLTYRNSWVYNHDMRRLCMSARQALVATSGRAGLAEGRIPQTPLKQKRGVPPWKTERE